MKQLCILILCTNIAFANFYKNEMEGWFAYKEANQTKIDDNSSTTPQPVKNQKIVIMPENLNDLSAKEFEALITQAKEISTMHPTRSNVKKFILLQNFVQKKADELTKVWGDVMLENPELDISVNIAKTSFARDAFQKEDKNAREEFFKNYSKYMTIVMFYDKNKKEVTKKQDSVMNFISYNYKAIKQLKIDVNNEKANKVLEKLKISKERLPDIFLMVDVDGTQIWKRAAIGLSTKNKIMNKVYEFGKDIFKEDKDDYNNSTH